MASGMIHTPQNARSTRANRARVRRSQRRWGLLGVSAFASMLALSAPSSAFSVAADAYLQDYTAQSGQIVTENGNTGQLANGACTFSWSAQAVIDTDLPGYSTNGFLESISPNPNDPGTGSGYLSLQHWANGAPSSQLNWRIPIAIDTAVNDAEITIVFDDPDWVVDQNSLQQYSEWTLQPGYESAFHRFTGITGYLPHDSNQFGVAVWGTDGGGNTVLTFPLGDFEPHTSMMLQFSGNAVSSLGMSGADNIAAGTAYGAKLVMEGSRPLSECITATYAPATVVAGDALQLNVSVDGGGISQAIPAGSHFALGAGAPNGLQLDSATGAAQWPVDANHPTGLVTVPVTLTLPDNGNFASGSQLTTTLSVDVQPRPADPVTPGPVTPHPATPGELVTAEEWGSAELAAQTNTGAASAEAESRQESGSQALPGERRRGPEAETGAAPALTGPLITLEVTPVPVPPALFFAGGGLLLGVACLLLIQRLRRR